MHYFGCDLIVIDSLPQVNPYRQERRQHQSPRTYPVCESHSSCLTSALKQLSDSSSPSQACRIRRYHRFQTSSSATPFAPCSLRRWRHRLFLAQR
jgi:hypothetical protein